MRFLRQEYWSGLPFPSPRDLPDPEIELSPTWAGGLFTTEPPGKPSATLPFNQAVRHHGWARGVPRPEVVAWTRAEKVGGMRVAAQNSGDCVTEAVAFWGGR